MASILDKLLQPIGRKAFLKEHRGVAPLHIKGDPKTVADLMSWEEMSRLMSMTSIWTPFSLKVVLERRTLPEAEYCIPVMTVSAGEILRPDPEKVQALIQRGASVALNAIESYNPALRAMSRSLQEMTGGTVQVNLYFSMRERQAFGPHFDVHDVYAVHCGGEKDWKIYERCEDTPVSHRALIKDDDTMDREAGDCIATHTLTPGDFLYIPRGHYHDALASANGAVHLAFGVTMPKPIDLLATLWHCAILEPSLREDLPVKPGKAALAKAMQKMGKKLQQMSENPSVHKAMAETLKQFASSKGEYDIAALTAEDVRYRVTPGIRLEQKDDKTLMGNGQKWVDIPAGLEDPIAWVLERDDVTEGSLGSAFASMSGDEVNDLIGNLRSMKVLT